MIADLDTLLTARYVELTDRIIPSLGNDDVDAPGQFLVDLQDFPDAAVLPVGGLGARVLQLGEHFVASGLVRAAGVVDDLDAEAVLLQRADSAGITGLYPACG